MELQRAIMSGDLNGLRPGASPQAVHSFATKGKTYFTADKDLR